MVLDTHNMASLVSFTLFFCLNIPGLASSFSAWNRSVAEYAVVDQLFATYDKRIRPQPVNGSGPVVVEVDMFINSLSDVNEIEMEYSMDIYLRLRWTDERLDVSKHNITKMTLTPETIAKLWKPDLYISNSVDGKRHDIVTLNEVVWLERGGDIIYSQRLSLTLSCPMQFQLFPGDNQTCSFFAESYGYKTDDLVFQWHKYKSSGQSALEFVDISLPEFDVDLKTAQLEDCTKTFSTGKFTCIGVRFFLKRNIGFYVTQVFIPSMLTVLLSWLSFFVDVKAAPARVSIGLLTVLTITTQTSGIRSQLPRVAYTKAIDIWMSVCLAFVVLAFFEYALAASYSAKENTKKTTKQENEYKENPAFEPEYENGVSGGGLSDRIQESKASYDWAHQKNGRTLWPGRTQKKFDDDSSQCDRQRCSNAILKNMDFYSRFIFPMCFVVFNITYWVLYF